MKILNMLIAAEEIKLNELDDEFQILILDFFNNDVDCDVTITSDMDGKQIRSIIENQSVHVRQYLLSRDVTGDSSVIVRFFSNIERIKEKAVISERHSDNVKETFFINLSVAILFITLLVVGIYGITTESRGIIPSSNIGKTIGVFLDGLHDVRE